MEVIDRLLQAGVLTQDTVAAISQQVEVDGISYEKALLLHQVPAEVVRTAFAQEYQLESFVLGKEDTLSEEVLRFIPEESAQHYRIVPLRIENDVLVIGVNEPENLEIREVLNFISSKNNLPYKFMFMLNDDIEHALTFYDSLSGEVGDALGSLNTNAGVDVEAAAVNELSQENFSHIKEDAPVTKIVATILRYAVDGGASDIHIEPIDEKIIVRFRVDGILAKSLELPKNVQSAVVARVKILASLRLDEKRKPQDGRFSANFDGRKIDFRVSILPINYGEKVVMRILDNEKGVSTLEDTGISTYDLQTIRRMIKEPYGIILISGPTGSGKSTSLYSMLSEVDRVSQNVLSLEDPIEYNIKGVSQSQVRPEIGYTFAAGLRSALRQDPDVIMVGEIRDKETAQLAVQAALTGHLVLSTIHTNNSVGVIPRLIDMGVDPYLIAPVLKLAIAQRLARRICPGTGKEVPVDAALQKMIETDFASLPEKYHGRIPTGKTVLHPEPSPGCASGTKGRVAVMEVLEINFEIQELILKNGSEEQMLIAARKNGFISMKEDAISKALSHVIPYEEIYNFGSKVGEDNEVEKTELVSIDEDTSLEEVPVDNIEKAETLEV